MEPNTEYPKRIPAPLGLSEWECSDGKIYYSKKSADAHESGINRKVAKNITYDLDN